MTTDEIIKTLDEFIPFTEDDPVNDNETFLYSLMDKWEHREDAAKAIPTFFRLMERHPDADFGSPGPLVHALESISGYESQLQVSLLRKPTSLALWMYNRVINAETNRDIIGAHIQRLMLYGKHLMADAEAKKIAIQFIEHQKQRIETV